MARKWIFLVTFIPWVFFSQSLWAQNASDGKKTYTLYCSGCHGTSGKGDGPLGTALPVKPANHADGAVMNRLSDDWLLEIISKGGGSVEKSPAMPSWGGQFQEKQIRDLISYIRSLAVPPYRPPRK